MNGFCEAVKGLKRNYTYWHNVKYRRFGPLWRDRYKSLLVENERYLSACGLYIESNPVKAGLVGQRQDWRYSSSRYYELGQPDELVDKYENDYQPAGIDIDDQTDFEKGMGIGSPYFKLMLRGDFINSE